MQVALYSYLYVVLANQDYSLLMGSIGLFVFVAIAMYFTRRMDWFDGSRTAPPLPTPTPPPADQSP
jgi:inner membrane protein